MNVIRIHGMVPSLGDKLILLQKRLHKEFPEEEFVFDSSPIRYESLNTRKAYACLHYGKVPEAPENGETEVYHRASVVVRIAGRITQALDIRVLKMPYDEFVDPGE